MVFKGLSKDTLCIEMHWLPLQPCSDQGSHPPFLLKYDFGPANYTIFITDLTYIWTESLDRKQIIRSALDTDTSIDPSEDAQQMQKFLQNLQFSLKGQQGTKLDLFPVRGEKHLTLHTSILLPAPLKPLEWLFHLTPAPESVFTSEFVLPCLSQQSMAKDQVTSLLHRLKEKDHVITRLIDTMQSDGIDWGRVFPGVPASRLGITRFTRSSVKGLDVFNEAQWRKQCSMLSSSTGDLVSRLFTISSVEVPEVTQLADYNNWWERSGHKSSLELGSLCESSSSRSEPKLSIMGTDDGMNPQADFQRQLVQKHLIPLTSKNREKAIGNQDEDVSSPKSILGSLHGGSTTDDSDDSVISSKLKVTPKKRIGGIGGSRSHLCAGSSTEAERAIQHVRNTESFGYQSSPPRPPKDVPTLSSNTVSVKHVHADKSAILASPEQSSNEKARARSDRPTSKIKLGKIGNKSKVDSAKEFSKPDTKIKILSPLELGGDACQQVESSMVSTSDGLGITSSQRFGRAIAQVTSPSPPRESSQDRAQRKRAQLKRELEDKSKVMGKKKRRF